MVSNLFTSEWSRWQGSNCTAQSWRGKPAGTGRAPAGAERSSALQRAMLTLVMPTYKRHFAPGDLQFLTRSTYRRAQLFETDRFRLLVADLRSAPACGQVVRKEGRGNGPKRGDFRRFWAGKGGSKGRILASESRNKGAF